jgi:phage shock protein A
VTATQRRQLKQKEQASAVAEDWYKRAQLALQKGNEELAREALSRRQQNMDEAESLQQQIDFQAASIDKLYDGMQILEKKIMESKSKKEQMVARARTAASTQKVNDMLGGLTGKTSMDAFNRMEDKVEALEAAAEVSSEMGALTGSAPASLENEFKLLEGNASVEDEMRKLKGLLGSSSSGAEGSSASSTSSSSTTEASSDPPTPAAPPTNSPEMDDEFEKLKKEAGL